MLRFFTCALLASVVSAQQYFSAALDGAQEVPPVATAGRGWSVVRFDPATNGVRVFVHYEALTGPPLFAHLHGAPAGANGGIIFGLTAVGANQFTGTAVLTPGQATALQSAGTYINVHTAANPGGEIRGQVVQSASTRFTGVLSGAQSVPANGSAATGEVVAFLHEPENRLVYSVDTTGLANVLFAHVHQAPAGSNGGIVFALNGTAGDYCGVSGRLTAAEVAALNADGSYVNVHTVAFPGGEIRAQLRKDLGDHFLAMCDSAQSVPPNGSPGLGSVNLIREPNGTLNVFGTFGGLTAATTVAHVHVAPAGSNGGVVFPLAFAGNTVSGSFVPSAAQLATLRGGGWYVNIHTAANPGGEIRGQLLPARLPTTYGQGCAGSNGTVPQIGASGFAAVGTTVSLDLYGGLPFSVALLAFGNNRDSFGPVPLPLELPVAGINSPGCYVLVEPSAVPSAFLDGFGCASLSLAVPFNPSLRGLAFRSQWLVLDPAASPGGFVASSALEFVMQ